MATQKIEKSMMMIKSSFGPMKSFKLIPISLECPFVEALFSPNEKIMVVISRTSKNSYHMVPKLDDNGDQIPVKGKPRPEGQKQIKEERRLVETFSEHYVVTEEEIRAIIDMFAINPKAFSIDEFFEIPEGIKENIIAPGTPKIIEKV
tara:strand:- start:752 stop:1195 length:444 start_codon:yes stop_codon:yes gene_type:complete